MEEYFILPEATPKSDPSWFGFLMTVRRGAPFTRDALVKQLNAKKIATRLLFGGNLLRQPYMKDRPYRVVGDLVNADIVVDHTFWIGVYPGLGQPQLDYVADTIRQFIASSAA